MEINSKDTLMQIMEACKIGRESLQCSCLQKCRLFLKGLPSKLAELEAQKEQLERYIRKMEEADREDLRKAQSPY
jgi:hypothetical protein